MTDEQESEEMAERVRRMGEFHSEIVSELCDNLNIREVQPIEKVEKLEHGVWHGVAPKLYVKRSEDRVLLSDRNAPQSDIDVARVQCDAVPALIRALQGLEGGDV